VRSRGENSIKTIEKSQTFSGMSQRKHHTHEHHHFHHHNNTNSTVTNLSNTTTGPIKPPRESTKKNRQSKNESSHISSVNHTKHMNENGHRSYVIDNDVDDDDAFSTSSISLNSEMLNQNPLSSRRNSKPNKNGHKRSVFNKLFNQGKRLLKRILSDFGE